MFDFMRKLYFVEEIMFCLEEETTVFWQENCFKEKINYVLEGDNHVYEDVLPFYEIIASSD